MSFYLYADMPQGLLPRVFPLKRDNPDRTPVLADCGAAWAAGRDTFGISGRNPPLAHQLSASNFFAPGAMPLAVRPAAITFLRTASDGDEMLRKNPR